MSSSRGGRSARDAAGARHRTGSRRKSKRHRYLERRAQWSALAEAFGGAFERAEKPLHDVIRIPHRGWVITVDTYLQSDGHSAVVYTRVQACFTFSHELTFRVYRANPFTRLLDRFAIPRVRVGDPRIDTRWVVRGSPVGPVRSFFLDGRLRAVLGEQESCRLEVGALSRSERKRWQGRVRQVSVRATGEHLETARVRGLIQLCMATLDRLATSGAASAVGPTARTGL